MWLPTGFGKSVYFQTLPFVFDYKLGLVDAVKKSVIAPLIALIVDQVRSLRKDTLGLPEGDESWRPFV